MPHVHVALISLPPLSGDAPLFATIVVALGTLIVGGRALLVWQSLSTRAAAVRRDQARVEEAEADMHGTFGRLRSQARELNAGVERVLRLLPPFDERVARARQALARERALLEGLRPDDPRALAGTIARIRGTLSVLRSARDLRRTILG